MNKKSYAILVSLLAGTMILAACSGSGTPTKAATAAPSAAASTAAATPVATISPENLSQKGHLLVCSDIPYPPQEMFDENGNPAGMDIEIGQEIASRLGLQFQVVNSVFDSIVAAVTSGKCDIAISAIFVTDLRKKQVSMITYFQARQAFVAAKGNPQHITALTDLCGKSAAAESGTTEADFLQGAGDFTTTGLPAQCQSASLPAPTVVITQKDSDALQQLQSGKVAVYSTDSPVAVYYQTQNPDQFEVVYQFSDPIPEGIMVPCGAEDCTNAPLSPVGQAVDVAFKSMIADGTYQKILAKWDLSNGAVTQ